MAFLPVFCTLSNFIQYEMNHYSMVKHSGEGNQSLNQGELQSALWSELLVEMQHKLQRLMVSKMLELVL